MKHGEAINSQHHEGAGAPMLDEVVRAPGELTLGATPPQKATESAHERPKELVEGERIKRGDAGVDDEPLGAPNGEATRPVPPSGPEPVGGATGYGQNGWQVLPLHTVVEGVCSCGDEDCSSPGKHPRTGGGLHDASADPDQIRAWWRSRPDSNIGIRTGAESGLIVLDVDPDHGGDESLAQLEALQGPLPATVQQRTGGGGRHYLFQHPGTPVRNRAGFRPGLDVRGDGGYIVAPPSRHISGERYEWSEGHSPGEIPLGRV